MAADAGPCIANKLCIRGTIWSPADCVCVPANNAPDGAPCEGPGICPGGTKWSATRCGCMMDLSCGIDADCYLERNYCNV